MDHLGGGPVQFPIDLLAVDVEVLASGLAGLLLFEHLVEDGHYPVLKLTIVGIGDDEVAYAVEALASQTGALELEAAHEGRGQALDEVLLDATGGGDDGRDVAVLDEVAQGATQARRDEVGGVAEEDGGLVAGVGVGPGAHVVDDVDGARHGRGLEAHVPHPAEQGIDGDGVAVELVEVELLDGLGVAGHVV